MTAASSADRYPALPWPDGLASALGERVPVGIVPPLAPDDSVQVVPLAVRRLIRSVIFDVRGEVLS